MNRSQYARNAITLMTGTGTGMGPAQATLVVMRPILTQFYNPKESGVFALYMAVAPSASVLFTGKKQKI